MRYVGIEATPEQLAGKCKDYFQDIFNDRQADFAFPAGDIEVLADAVSMIFDSRICIFLIFAVPEHPWELFNMERLTGRKQYEPLAACHLTDFHGLSAYAHFSMHPKFVPYKEAAIGLAEDFLFWLFGRTRRDEPGVPFVTTLLGLTPRYNIGAIRFAKAIGFKKAAVIKKGMYSRIKGRYCDVVLATLSKDVYV